MPERKPTRADAVRGAVDDAFAAAAGQAHGTTRRAQDLVDELTQTAGRVQRTLDDLRPASGDEVRELRRRVDELEERLAALEQRSPDEEGSHPAWPHRSSPPTPSSGRSWTASSR